MKQTYLSICLLLPLWGCLGEAPPGQKETALKAAPKKAPKAAPAVRATPTSAPLPPPIIAPLDKDAKVPLLRTQMTRTPEPARTDKAFGISPKDESAFKVLSESVLNEEPQENGPEAPPIKRLDNGRLQIGRIIVDREQKSLKIPSQVNMSEGLLEYYAVGPQGKLHESVLVLFAPSSHIHLSLILLGAEPGKPNGTRLDLTIEWTDRKTGKPRTAKGHEWLLNRKTKKSPDSLTWFFSGSRFFMGKYSGDQSQSTISLIADPEAVIDVIETAGVPYRGDALGFQAHKEVMPAVGTRTTLHVKVLHTPIPMFPPPKDKAPDGPVPDVGERKPQVP